MTSKTLALLSGVSCVAVLATYAWAASQEVKEVKVEEAPAIVEEVAAKVEESAEPERQCIPMAEAKDATAPAAEASAEGAKEEAKTEEPAEAVKTEEVAAEAALPICDEDGNPPAPEGEAAESEAAPAESAEAAVEEPAKEEPAKTE